MSKDEDRRSPMNRLDSLGRRDDDASRHQFPHPNSPAARTFEWWRSGFRHPDSPSARISGVHEAPAALEFTTADEFAALVNDLDQFLAGHSAAFRENLPDDGVKDIYDDHVQLVRVSNLENPLHGRSGPDGLKTILQTAAVEIDWFDERTSCDRLVRISYTALLGPSGDEGLESRLIEIRTLVQDLFAAASASIRKKWAHAAATGTQQELIREWSTRMLQRRSFLHSGGGAADTRPSPSELGNDAPKGLGPGTPRVKTWVAFQLVDADGAPVPYARYRIKLPDGSTAEGALNSDGTVRLDQIDPGECQISFPEIDANEWSRV